ncbi:MAG: hypothetical protein IKR40_10335 [Treponema sp.]|nr:hypothetical protein [Treponema sp.]
MPIQIIFSTVIDPDQIIGNISIKLNRAEKIGELFDEPLVKEIMVNGEKKTQVTINPKPAELKNFITKNFKTPEAEAKVSLSEKISVTKDDIILPLQQDEKSSFSVWYEPTSEEEPPVINTFSVTVPRYDMTNFNPSDGEHTVSKKTIVSGTLENLTGSKIPKNRTKDTVYIRGSYTDGVHGSGIKNIIVTEQRTNNLLGEIVTESPIVTEYNIDDVKYDETEGNVFFKIEYKIESEDGAVLFNVSASDNCENISEPKEFTLFKKSHAVFDDSIEVTNSLGDVATVADVKESVKNIKIEIHRVLCSGTSGFTRIYKSSSTDVHFTPSQIYGLCEYTEANGTKHSEKLTLDNTENTAVYKANLALSVNSLPGTKMKIVFYDDIGNSAEKEWSFIYPENVSYTTRKSASNKAQVFAEESTGIELSKIGRIIENESTGEKTIHKGYGGSTTTMDFGYSYIFVPFANGFYTYPSEGKYSMKNLVNSSSGYKVTLKKFSGSSSYVKISQNPNYGYFNVSVLVDSWSIFDKIALELYGFEDRLDEVKYFSKSDGNECTIPVELEEFGEVNSGDTRTLKVYGISGNTSSLASTYSFSFTDADFRAMDNSGAYCKVSGTADIVKCSIIDLTCFEDYVKPAGIKNAKIILNGTVYSPEIAPDGKAYLSIPAWELSSQGDIATLYFESCDNNNNTSSGYRNITLDKYCSFSSVEKNGSKWNIVGSTGYRQLNIETLNTNTTGGYNSWQVYSNPIDLTYSSSAGLYQAVFPSGYQFCKIYTPADTGLCVPAYVYTGSASTTGKYNLILANGGSKDSVAVSSDAPVFVHTVITKKPYSVCKTWSAKKWETFQKHCGDMYMSFSSTDHTPQRYDIPMTEINAGECYVVIAHFANNKTQISEVMQK